MANELLDFVISLVRDPDAAARYAANPAQSIADAHLANVTSTDVNNLIPVVSDTLSPAIPGGAGVAVVAPTDHSNVWASGAAAAALDSFTPHPVAGVVDHLDQQGAASSVISQLSAPGPGQSPAGPGPFQVDPHAPSVLLTGLDVVANTADHGVFPTDDPGIWGHSAIHPDPATPGHHGFGVHG
ncbi:MAG: Rv0340 family IniB-related protein [Mycobacterium sp.]